MVGENVVSATDLSDWLYARERPDTAWYLKRLSANDTLANETHQAGPYLSKDLLFEVFPDLQAASQLNPDVTFSASIDSHTSAVRLRAVWYNNRLFGGTRNECRITNWGGQASPVLDPESTGALAVFVFQSAASEGEIRLRVWLCRNIDEEDLVESQCGVIEPGRSVTWYPGRDLGSGEAKAVEPRGSDCYLSPERLPPEWRKSFPPALEIVEKVREIRPLSGRSVDDRLWLRRQCEYELFRSIEDCVEGPVISSRFDSVAEFLTHAQRLLQRRKARAGKSLELQTKAIFEEEGMRPP